MIVRKLRLQHGWSQDQLAEFTGLSVRTIQRLERGHRPGLETAKALASVFEVDFSTFIIEEDADMNEKVELKQDEKEALEWAKSVKEYVLGLVMYAGMAVVFFAVFGFGVRILYWVFLGVGAILVIQGLFLFEVIRLPLEDWEKRLTERRLGRKL